MQSIRFAFFIGVMLILSWRCNPDKNLSPVITEDEKSTVKRERLFYKSNIPFVRLRATPDNNANIILTLEKGTLVEYMYDSTLFETTVKVGGNTYQSTWFYVRTSNNMLGWSQKILFNPLSYLENKQLAKQIPVYDPDRIEEKLSRSALKERQEVVNQQLIQRLRSTISTQSATDIASAGKVVRFNQSYILEKSNKKTTDVAFMETYQFINNVAKQIPSTTIDRYQLFYDDIQSYGSYNIKYDNFCASLAKNYLHFSTRDNKVIAEADIDLLLRVFYKEMSAQMRTFIDLNTSLNIDELQIEKIPIKSIEDAILESHSFVLNNKDFLYWEQAKQQYSKLLQRILQSSKKDPIFEKNNQMKKCYVDLYISLSKQKKNKDLASIFKKMVSFYTASDWKASSDWVSFTNEITDQILGLFNE